jgi:hypothetical protein
LASCLISALSAFSSRVSTFPALFIAC